MNSNCWCCFVFLVLDMTIELMIVHHQKKSTKATKTLATTTTPQKRTHKFECTHENCDHTRCYVPWKPREQQRNFDVHFFLNEPQKWNERKKKNRENILFTHTKVAKFNSEWSKRGKNHNNNNNNVEKKRVNLFSEYITFDCYVK